MQKNVSSGPHAIHIENRDESRMLTAVRRLCGQPAGSPRGVADQFTRGEIATDFVVGAED